MKRAAADRRTLSRLVLGRRSGPGPRALFEFSLPGFFFKLCPLKTNLVLLLDAVDSRLMVRYRVF